MHWLQRCNYPFQSLFLAPQSFDCPDQIHIGASFVLRSMVLPKGPKLPLSKRSFPPRFCIFHTFSALHPLDAPAHQNPNTGLKGTTELQKAVALLLEQKI